MRYPAPPLSSARTRFYDPTTSVGASARSGRNKTHFFQGDIHSPPRQKVWDGVIVRSAWKSNNNRSNPLDGEFVQDVTQPIGFSKITDGTSKTMIVSEKYVRNDLYQGGSWSDDKGWTDGWDPDTMRSTCYPPKQDSEGFPEEGAFIDGLDTRNMAASDVINFGGAHPGGINVAFADGSVRLLNYDVDIILFNNLGDRRDGEVVDLSTL